MDWLSAVQLFVLSQGLLLLVIILTVRSENPVANKLLAMFIGINTLGIALHLAVRTEVTIYQPFYIVYLLMIMKGPLIYLYVRSLTEHQFAFVKQLLTHALCLLPGLIAWFAIAPDEPSPSTPGSHSSAVDHAISVFYLLNSLILFVYGVAALRLLRSHQHRLQKTFSSLGPITLGWLKWLILYIITLRLAYIGTGLLLSIGVLSQQPSIFLLLDFGVIYLIAIGGLRQPRIFTGNIQEILKKVEQPALSNKPEKVLPHKYERSALDDSEINAIWQKLTTCFQRDHAYMREDLNLSQLAELLEVTSHDLSQVINLRSGGNFYELVNHYRIEKAQQLLRDPDNRQRKLLDIAMEVGYKSQSTFYSQFSKHSGTTPRKYRETHCALTN